MDRIRAMRAYCLVVERGTLTAAATELRVGQPTLSKWLARLEAELGVQLIERSTRRLHVTDAGHAFHVRARELVAAWDATREDLGASAGRPVGRVRASVPVVFGERHLIPLLPGLVAAHPGLQLDLVFSDAYVDLLQGGFDLALRVGAPVDSSMRARTLARAGRRLVASPAWVAAHGAPAHPAELSAAACLVHRGTPTRAVWTFQRGDQVVRAPVGEGAHSANHSGALAALCLAGAGVALLATWLVDDAIAEGRLVPLLPGWTLPPAPVRAVLPPGGRVPARVRAVLDHLAAALPNRLSRIPE